MIDPLAVDERRVAEALRLEEALGKGWWLPKPGEPVPGDKILIVIVKEIVDNIGRPIQPNEPFVEMAQVTDRREANCDEIKFGCVVGDWNPKLDGQRFVCFIETEGWAWCRGWDAEDAAVLLATWWARQAGNPDR